MGFSTYSNEIRQFKIPPTTFLSKLPNIMFTNISDYTVGHMCEMYLQLTEKHDSYILQHGSCDLIIIGLQSVVRSDVECELLHIDHTSVLLLKQLCTQADKWHLKLQPDISELQNR